MSKRFLRNKEIVESVLAVGIPKDELVVVGGAALQLIGIKRTSDIDVVLSMPTLLERIEHRTRDIHNGRRAMHSPIDSETVTPEGIDFTILDWVDFYNAQSIGKLALLPAPNDRFYSVSFEELHDEAIDIQGLFVSPPERILTWKQAIGREKDVADIIKIQTYLAQAAS